MQTPEANGVIVGLMEDIGFVRRIGRWLFLLEHEFIEQLMRANHLHAFWFAHR